MKLTGLLILACLTLHAESAKILGIFPFTCKSQHILGSVLLKELASRGHEVTMISPFPLETKVKNYEDVFLESMINFRNHNMSDMIDPNNNVFRKIWSFFKSVTSQTEIYLQDKNLVRFLGDKPKFDVVIQAWSLSEATLGIGFTVGAPTIGFSVMGGFPSLYYHSGMPQPYSYVSNIFLPYTDEMNLYERAVNIFTNLIFDLAIKHVNLPHQKAILAKNFPNAPPLEKLLEDVDLHLINSHFATESPRPYLPNVIQIGGFHLEEKEILSDTLKNFMDKSKNGVIFLSFGTNIKSSTLPQNTVPSIIKTFKKFKYDFLWKFDENLTDLPGNVLISNWVPQRAVLEHKNLQIFITHGGLGSTVEAIYHGVPMICVPFFGDQQKNVADAVQNGYGLHLDLHEINEASLTKAILEITENDRYRKNIKIRSDIYRNQEVNPMDKAVYWIEHVIKYKGAKHLKSKASNLSYHQYMLFDVVGIFTIVLLIVLFIAYKFVKSLFKLCFAKSVKKIKKN